MKRRAFSEQVIGVDNFIEMPLSTQALYMHLMMGTDDDGFVGSPKRIQKAIGAADDDFKLLIAKGYIIKFASGVVVISHFKMQNTLKNDRYTETIYKEEKAMLTTIDKVYSIPEQLEFSTMFPDGFHSGSNLVPQHNITKHNITEQDIYIVEQEEFGIFEEGNDVIDVIDRKTLLIEQVIAHLNSRTGSNYKTSTENTRKLISGRMKEGYTLQDFVTVIDKKYAEWAGTDMEKFLRPDTLFRPANFEAYLNQKGTKKNRSATSALMELAGGEK